MKLSLYIFLLLILVFFWGCASQGYEIVEEVAPDKPGTISDLPSFRSETSELKEESVLTDTVQPFSNRITGPFTIQIGAFLDESNAIKFLNSAKTSLSMDVSYSLSDGFYKIRTGTFLNTSEALLNLNNLRNSGFSDAFIIVK